MLPQEGRGQSQGEAQLEREAVDAGGEEDGVAAYKTEQKVVGIVLMTSKWTHMRHATHKKIQQIW